MRVNGKDFEVVRKSGERSGYIREKPDRSNPTPAQLENQLRFGKAAFNSFGRKEEENLPPAALAVKEEFLQDLEEKSREIVEVLKRSRFEELLEEAEFESAGEIIRFLQNID